MKKYLTLCIAALMLSACGDSGKHAHSGGNEASMKTTYRVGSHLTYPPFHFQGQKGEPIGFEVELLQEVAKAGGFEVNINNAPRQGMVQTLNDGTFDLWSSTVTINPERQAEMDFSHPFLQTDPQTVYILDNEKNKNIRTAEDLKGKKLAVNDFSKRPAELAAKLTGTFGNVLTTKSYHLSMKAVYSGEVDGALDNGYVLAYYVKNYPEPKVRPIVVENQKKDFAFAVKKGNTAVLADLNKGLDKVKADGTYDRLLEKWFGKIELPENVASPQ